MFGKKQSFLALDIGINSVKGFGMVRNGSVKTHELYTEHGPNLKENIINAIDAIETKLGVKFKGAFITGNFGTAESKILTNTVRFARRRKISDADIYGAIFNSPDVRKLGGTLLHLIPLQFLIDGNDVPNANDCLCDSFAVRFNAMTYPDEILNEIKAGLMSACFPALGFFDPMYLLGKSHHKKGDTSVFIDFGKTKTAVAVYKDRGMVRRFDISVGQDEITKRLESDFGISYADAEDIKLSVLNKKPAAADEYILASNKYNSLMQSDVWDVWNEVNGQIVDRVISDIKYEKFRLFITGAGANMDNINALILRNKGLEDIYILSEYAIVGAFGKMFLKNMGPNRRRIIKLKRPKSIPVIPSVMCWNFKSAHVYDMFEAVGIRKVHADIMDGFYTTKVSGTLDDLTKIRARTRMAVHTHLMVEDPLAWIPDVLKSGADIIIVSTGARNIVRALKEIKLSGRQCGLALSPDFNLKELKPELLTMLDEVMVMGVVPGASGQKFLAGAVKKIKILANTRDKYGFRYKISVDGGINDETAPMCWDAGADFLISGNYLHAAPDFTDAVVKLLPKK